MTVRQSDLYQGINTSYAYSNSQIVFIRPVVVCAPGMPIIKWRNPVSKLAHGYADFYTDRHSDLDPDADAHTHRDAITNVYADAYSFRVPRRDPVD